MNRIKKISKFPMILPEDQPDIKQTQLNLFGSKVALNVIKSPKKASVQDSRVPNESQEPQVRNRRYFNLNSINKRKTYATNNVFQVKTTHNSGQGSIFSKSKALKPFEISPKSNKSARSPSASKSRIRIFRERVENLMKV